MVVQAVEPWQGGEMLRSEVSSSPTSAVAPEAKPSQRANLRGLVAVAHPLFVAVLGGLRRGVGDSVLRSVQTELQLCIRYAVRYALSGGVETPRNGDASA